MRKLSMVIALGLLCACKSNSTPPDMPSDAARNVVIKTVDKKNNEFRAEKVKWWYSAKPGAEHKLDCDQDSCSEWIIDEEISGPITVNASASIVQENDEQCFDWYEGEAVVVANPGVDQEMVIVLSYRATACR